MPYLFISSDRLYKRLDALESELSACHDRLNVLSDLYRKLGYVNTNLLRIYERLDTMQRAWDDLVAEVRQLSDLDESVKAGFAALELKLQEAIDRLGNAPSVAEVDALRAEVAGAVADVRAAIPA
jgi:DNA repair ATPase RecN